jgi:peptidoglycan/xylan/chitin deacetylase (PgdA/CDA1 family)
MAQTPRAELGIPTRWRFLVPVLLCAACAAPSGPNDQAPRSGIPVLVYHEIRPDGSQAGETVISLARFNEQMRYLAERGYTTLSIGELVAFMQGKPLRARRPIVLTFDDGWKSVLQALPVLEEHGFKASFWIISHTGIGDPHLDWSDVVGIAANPNFEIGSHTATHPWDPVENLVTWADGRVPGKGLPEISFELEASRRELERRLSRPIRYLAWPRGWYNDALIERAREAGYEATLTTDEGVNSGGDDAYRIKRLFVDGACDLQAFERMLREARYRVCQTSRRPTQGSSPYPYQERNR